MKKNPFRIGDRVELTHVASALGRVLAENKYMSQVLDFDEIRTIKIAMPMYEGKIVPLELGDDYQLVFFTKAGLYQCTAKVAKRYTEKNMHVMDLVFQSKLVKYQRRKYFRLDCTMSFRYKVSENGEGHTEEADSGKEEKNSWKDGTIIDLSGGGLRFQCMEEIEKDSCLEVKIPLSFAKGIVPIQFMTKIIECKKNMGNSRMYDVRGEFEGVSDSERETVIQFVFEEQRRRMRKE